MKIKILALIALALVATIIDWLVIRSGVMYSQFLTWWYILTGWFLVWEICLGIMRSFKLSIASVIAISLCEDFLFMCAVSLFDGRQFYPLYCHGWLPAPLGYNWLGLPSAYYISILAIAIILLAGRLKTRGRVATSIASPPERR